MLIILIITIINIITTETINKPLILRLYNTIIINENIIPFMINPGYNPQYSIIYRTIGLLSAL